MNWNNLQIGKKKAEKRIPKDIEEPWRTHALQRARKTTTRCSVTIHG